MTDERLSQSVQDLELSVRTSELLQRANVATVGELVSMTKEAFVHRVAGETPSLKDIMRMKKSLNEIEELLGTLNLSFVEHADPDQPPESVKDLDIPNMLDEEDFD